MLPNPRIPEINRRDRFVRRVAGSGRLYAVAGESGLARVPSQKQSGREAIFLWSSRAEAERWAGLVAENPRIKEIGVGEALGDFLPALAAHARLVGTDWSDDEVEPEIEPMELAERLRLAAVDRFVEGVMKNGRLWILEDANGPALLVSATRVDQLLLPCWAERDAAEQRIEGPWADMLAIEIPQENFLRLTLPWLRERGWLIAPEHVPGVAALELPPEDLGERLGLPVAAE